MSQKDRLHRFIFDHSHVRGEFVRLEHSWQSVLELHDYPPAVRKLLGEACAASVLLSATVKFRGSLILQIQGDGPVSMLVVQVDNERKMRAMADYSDREVSGSLKDMFGEGRLVITIEQKEGRERYQGIVELGNGSLKEALEAYFEKSEQLNTKLWFSANENFAAGLLLQELPSGSEEGAFEEDKDIWNRVGQLADTIQDQEMYTLSVAEILHRLFHEEEVRLFDPETIEFSCSCSREKIERTLHSIGYDELKDLLEERGLVEVDCSFCNRHYEFDSIDIEQIFTEQVLPEIPTTRH